MPETNPSVVVARRGTGRIPIPTIGVKMFTIKLGATKHDLSLEGAVALRKDLNSFLN